MKMLVPVILFMSIVSIALLSFYLLSDEKSIKFSKSFVERIDPRLDDYKCENFTPGMQYPYKPKNITTSTTRSYDVIVIGAGIAGLEAAHQLQSEHVNVMILEGRDRIGGRVYTNNETGIPLDLGGSWIHGLNKHGGLENPIYKIALKNDIAVKETYETTTLYDSFGNQIDDRSYDVFDKYERFAEKYGEQLTDQQRQKLSVQDVIDIFYDSTTDSDVKNRIMYDYIMQWNYDMEQAENTTMVSFANSDVSTFYEDDEDEAVFLYGYSQIANCLAGGLNILHANVTRVDYRNQIVEIFTDQGSDPFKANYTISTLPLGILQSATTSKVVFVPDFDQAKKEAIGHLMMGTMDKTYLIFNDDQTPFWSSSTWINRVSEDGQTHNATNKRWQFFFNLYNYNQEPILLAFNTGKTAKELEHEDATTIKEELTKTLETMYHRDIDDSEFKIFPPITKWASDPLSGGSYSIIPINGSLDDFDKIATPIDDKLFFAGEATNKYYYGTVHGAYISGYRAAEEILKVKDDQNLDSPREQLEHGIKRWDIICKNGETLVGMTSNDDVKCIKK